MKNSDLSTTKINSSNTERDLGIHIATSLKSSEHIKVITNKANKVLGCIKRSFTYLDNEMLVTLYKSLVRPIVEYGSPVWSPHMIKDITEVEKIQRQATKLVPDIKDLPYTQRLLSLGLPTLLYRRDRRDLIEVFCTLQSPNQTLFNVSESTRLRGHSKKIVKEEHYRRNVRLNFFSQRTINTWNSLPDSVVSASTLNQFKSLLNSLTWHDNKFNFPY